MGLFYVSVEAKPKPQTSKAFPTRLRRPHLFRLAGKDGGEQGLEGTRRLLRYTKFDSSCL